MFAGRLANGTSSDAIIAEDGAAPAAVTGSTPGVTGSAARSAKRTKPASAGTGSGRSAPGNTDDVKSRVLAELSALRCCAGECLFTVCNGCVDDVF